jgi:hypothetical protein
MNLARKGLTYLVNESIYEGLLWSMVYGYADCMDKSFEGGGFLRA